MMDEKLNRDLLVAAHLGKPVVMKRLISQGGNVNVVADKEHQVGYTAKINRGMTPLVVACWEGHLKCVDILLANDAHVNYRCFLPYSNSFFKQNLSALKIAVMQGHDDIVPSLLKSGAMISGLSELCENYSRSMFKSISLLLENSNVVNSFDDEGMTPLMSAVANKSSDLPLIQLLINKGADLSMTNHAGKTAIDIAKIMNHEFFEYLNSIIEQQQLNDTIVGQSNSSQLLRF